MKIDLLTGSQEINHYFSLFSLFFFASITLSDGFFQFQDNKVNITQAPGHNHEL